MDPLVLDLHSLFYTIQGEGPFSGVPAVFIRLAGCNLQCPGCDTIYTTGRAGQTSTIDLVNKARDLFPSTHKLPRLVVITGGEPFRQNISALCHDLLACGFMVQIETNGTYAPAQGFPEPGQVRVVCSPKAGKVAEGLLPYVSAYKYVIDAYSVDKVDGLPTRTLVGGKPPARPHQGFRGPIYVSPLDEQDIPANKLNRECAARTCMTHGYILNLQVHKIVNLP